MTFPNFIAAVSIFTLPECEMASNPGQKKDGSSSSNAHSRGMHPKLKVLGG
jgi:hypothetical protein